MWSLFLSGINPYPAVIAVDHALNCGKTHADTFGGLFVNLIIRIEDLFLVLRGDTDTIIGNPVQCRIIINAAINANLPGAIRVEIFYGII